jgi:hypothetical protein
MYAGRGSTNSKAVGGIAYANGFALLPVGAGPIRELSLLASPDEVIISPV